MEIDKSQIIAMLRDRGAQSEADQAESELPQQVNPTEHADLLGRFGLDPQDLVAKLGGGGMGGGLGGALGGLMGKKD